MHKRYKFDIWDVIIWISLIVLVLYIIGKIMGFINTPEWISLMPIITLVFFAGAFYQKVLSFMNQIYVRTDYLKNNVDKINTNIIEIKKDLSQHDKRIFSLERRKQPNQ